MSVWTIDSLKEHLEAMREAQHRELSNAIFSVEKTAKAALDSSKEAVLKAENATEKRFEGVNEFRATLTDQAARFVTRKEMWGYIVAGIATIAAIVEMLRK